ncbi:hypothetical protein SCUP234_09714 [Seiridium cupressi]
MVSWKWLNTSCPQGELSATARQQGQTAGRQEAVEAMTPTERYSRNTKPQFWMEGEVIPEICSRREGDSAVQQGATPHQWIRWFEPAVFSPLDQPFHRNDSWEGSSTHESRTSCGPPKFDDSDKQATAGRAPLVIEVTSPVESYSQQPRWYKRKKAWVMAALITLVMIGVILGVVYGVYSRKSNDSSTAPLKIPDPCKASLCDGTICAQILSAAIYDDPWDNGVDLFTIAKGGDLWYLSAQARGTGGWISLGGDFQSQPVAVVWNSSQRLDVFGVHSSNGVIYKSFEGNEWSGWRGLGGKATSGVSACHSQYHTDRPDIWTLISGADGPEVINNYWDTDVNDWADNGTHPGGHTWQSTLDQAPYRTTNSTPAVVCRNDEIMHDVVMYDRDTSTVLHRQWSSSHSKWLDWNDRGGSFIGEPVVVSPSDDRIDFFGIGRDYAMYHFSWSNSSGYTDLENLNGSWASIPSVVKMSDERLDVVALGTDGNLKQRALVGLDWQKEWQDLGVMARSAPLAIRFNSTSSIGIFALGSSGELLRGDYEINTDGSWQTMTDVQSVGGNLMNTWSAAC